MHISPFLRSTRFVFAAHQALARIVRPASPTQTLEIWREGVNVLQCMAQPTWYKYELTYFLEAGVLHSSPIYSYLIITTWFDSELQHVYSLR